MITNVDNNIMLEMQFQNIFLETLTFPFMKEYIQKAIAMITPMLVVRLIAEPITNIKTKHTKKEVSSCQVIFLFIVQAATIINTAENLEPATSKAAPIPYNRPASVKLSPEDTVDAIVAI